MKHLDYNHPEFDCALFKEVHQGGLQFLNQWFTNISQHQYFIVQTRNPTYYNDPSKAKKLESLNKSILKTTSILYYLSQPRKTISNRPSLHPPPGFYNIDFLIFLIQEDENAKNTKISQLQLQFVEKVLNFLLHHSNCNTSLKISYLKIFLEFSHIRKLIFTKYWTCSSYRRLGGTIIGNILLADKYDLYMKHIQNFLQYLNKTFKDSLYQALDNIVEVNKHNHKTNSIVTLTYFKHIKILVRLVGVMLEMSTENSESVSLPTRRHNPFLHFAVHFFSAGVVPLIYYLKYEKKNISLAKSVIQIEKGSLRWKHKPLALQTFLSQKNQSLRILTQLYHQKEKYISTPFIRSLLLRFANTIASIFVTHLPNPQTFFQDPDVPDNLIQNIILLLTYNFDNSNDNNLEVFSGIDMFSIKQVTILALNTDDWNLTPDLKRELILFYSRNIDLLKRDFIQNKLNSRVFVNSTLEFYNSLQKEIDESSVLHKDKLIIRDNIFDIWLHLLQHHGHFQGTLFLTFYNIKLQSIFTESSKVETTAVLCIMDGHTVLERLFESAQYVMEFPELVQRTQPLKKQLRLEDILYKKMGGLYQDQLLLRNTLQFLQHGCAHFPTVFSTSMVLPKIAMCVNFFLTKMKSFRLEHTFSYFGFTVQLHKLYSQFLTFVGSLSENKQFCTSVISDVSGNFEARNYKLLVGQAEHTFGKESTQFTQCQRIYNTIVELQMDHTSLSGDEPAYTEPVPEHFCDPLLMTPIEEPYMLPESKLFTEKNTILSHLCLSETDPFNRTPLTIADLHEYNRRPEIVKQRQEFTENFQTWKKTHTSCPHATTSDDTDNCEQKMPILPSKE